MRSFPLRPVVLLTMGAAIALIANCKSLAQESVDRITPSTATTTQSVDDGQLPTGRKIEPAGDLISFHGRPVDLKTSHDGRWLFVKDRGALRIINIQAWKLVQTVASPTGASLWGLAADKNNRVYFTDSKAGIHVYAVSDGGEKNTENKDQGAAAGNGLKSDDSEEDLNDSTAENETPATIELTAESKLTFQLERTIQLPADSFPCGIVLSADGAKAYVCLSKKNSLAVVDLTTDNIEQTIDVGVAPFDVMLLGDQLLVSNIGGRLPVAADATATSAGTPTVVDERGIASTGTVSQIDLKTNTVTQTFDVSLHPTVLARGLADHSAVVCNTNDDSISLLTTGENGGVNTVAVKPDPELPFGSMPSAICYLEQIRSYAVALAGNNAIALVEPGFGSLEPEVTGLIPTAWYPVALDVDDQFLYVACVKGLGGASGSQAGRTGA